MAAQAAYLQSAGWLPVAALSPLTGRPIEGAPLSWNSPYDGSTLGAAQAVQEQECHDNDIFYRD